MDGIVVGVDDAGGSGAALRWAIDEARLRHRPLRVVSAWEFPFDDPRLAQAAASEPGPPLADEARAELTATVDGVAGGPGGLAGLEITEHVVHGSPVRVLLDAAAGADLLVVGSRGRGAVPGLLLGSVSREVARRAPCPVVIVREPDDPRH